jgi:hypothetical protein
MPFNMPEEWRPQILRDYGIRLMTVWIFVSHTCLKLAYESAYGFQTYKEMEDEEFEDYVKDI